MWVAGLGGDQPRSLPGLKADVLGPAVRAEVHKESELMLIFCLQVNVLYLHVWGGYLFSVYLA